MPGVLLHGTRSTYQNHGTNLTAACRSCNARKSTQPLVGFLVGGN